MSELTCDSVQFSYRGNLVIRDFSHHFSSGELTALTGPSGCGKSTLLFLLGNLLRPQEGAVFWDGRAVHAGSERGRAHFRSEVVGFVFQDAALDAGRSVEDNIVEGSLYRRQSRSLARAKAMALMDTLGVAVPASRRPGQLSGGQAQRIALCRALLGDPGLILADEPTGNLDDDSSRLVLSALERRAERGAVVVIATHDPRVLTMATRQVTLP